MNLELKVKLHSIEIVGGGTRMPSLQKIIQEIFGMECSRTLHSTECISRGAAIQVINFPFIINEIGGYVQSSFQSFKLLN